MDEKNVSIKHIEVQHFSTWVKLEDQSANCEEGICESVVEYIFVIFYPEHINEC